MISILLFLTATAVSADQLATDKDYNIVTSGTTSTVKAGAKGTVQIAIEAKNGFHLSPDTPMNASLSTTPGLKLSADKLSRKELDNGKWTVSFDATAPGEQQVKSDFVFFLCSDKLCQRMTASRAIPVTVN